MPTYTRSGDKGETALLGGKKVSKDHPCVEAFGSLDELNSLLGLAIAFSDDSRITEPLKKAQKSLFVIGSELASDKQKSSKVTPFWIDGLEKEIDSLDADLPSLRHFILPGGSKTASLLHHARTVCRRAERRVVTLSSKHRVNPESVRYLNRLGDLLFVMARYVNRKKRKDEVLWSGG